MPSCKDLNGLVDGLPGSESLPDLARAAGCRFGCSLPGVNTLSDPDYVALWERNTAVTVIGCYMTVQTSAGVFNLANTETLLGLAASRETQIHAVYYPHASLSPAWMVSSVTSENWRQMMEDHCDGLAPVLAASGMIHVYNEALDQNGGTRSTWLADASNGEDVVEGFKIVRERYPQARLLFSEGDIEGDARGTKRTAFLAQVDALLEITQDGLPVLDGICLQGHIGLGSSLRFQGAGYRDLLHELVTVRELPVYVTEHDIGNFGITDIDAFDALAAETAYRFFAISIEEGVRWFNTWYARNDASWLHAFEPDFTQRPLPFDDDGRPTQIERAIRAAFQGAAGS